MATTVQAKRQAHCDLHSLHDKPPQPDNNRLLHLIPKPPAAVQPILVRRLWTDASLCEQPVKSRHLQLANPHVENVVAHQTAEFVMNLRREPSSQVAISLPELSASNQQYSSYESHSIRFEPANGSANGR